MWKKLKMTIFLQALEGEYILKKNMLNTFLDKLFAFPMWVKQIILLRLYQNLELKLSEDFITTNESDVFQVYVPELTFLGRTELSEQKAKLDDNVYTFMNNVSEGISILEIAMNNFWTLEEVAKCFIIALDLNYVKTTGSVCVFAMAGFMSGKFRTGEYFKRVGRINVDQLEHVIIAQKKAISAGQNTRIAEIMISMGLITEKDTASLLLIKEEAKQRFILDSSIVPNEIEHELKKRYESEILKLQNENTMLKDKLVKVISMLKKND